LEDIIFTNSANSIVPFPEIQTLTLGTERNFKRELGIKVK